MEATFDPIFDLAFEGGLLQEIKIAEVGIFECSNNNFYGSIPVNLFSDDQLSEIEGEKCDYRILNISLKNNLVALSISSLKYCGRYFNRKIFYL
jgi:hypothetical protein